MSHRKLLAGVAMIAALGAGATAGVFLGVPGLSGAQTPTPTSSASPTPGGGHRGPGFGLKGGASLQVAAKDLSMTPAELKTALQGGQSIAALAKAKNVDPQKIINDMVADATTRIDAAASSGKITSAQATKIKAGLTARFTAFVNGTHPAKLGLKPSFDVAAKDLNMTPAELKTALQGGQSIAALAKAKNVDPQKIVNDVVADATTRIDAAASSGKVTSDQATKMKAGLTARITAFVNGTGAGRGHGPRGPFGGHEGPEGPEGQDDQPTSTATPASN